MQVHLRSISLAAVLTPLLSSCATFATVRSADVRPGPSLGAQVSVSTPPGDVAGWLWSLDCVEACSHPVVGGDLGVTYGWRLDHGPQGVALGVGVSGIDPYVDGYLQLAGGRHPLGVGTRIGAPVLGWREDQLYLRYDVPLGESTRLLLDPGVFRYEGHSPNGANTGRFRGFVQGIGVQFDGGYVSWTPAVAVIAGTAQHGGYGDRYGPERSVFGTASLGVTLHRKRPSDNR